MSKPELSVDFDGVIHSYERGWMGIDIILDPPVPGALRWLQRAQEFWRISVYSSRSEREEGRRAMRNIIYGWALIEFDDSDIGVVRKFVEELNFPEHKPAAFLTIDDRALCFKGDWSALDPQKLLEFKPWNKK